MLVYDCKHFYMHELRRLGDKYDFKAVVAVLGEIAYIFGRILAASGRPEVLHFVYYDK